MHNGISEANVVLKKVGSDNIVQGQYMAKSNRRGEVTLKSLPFGSYQLTVEPPGHYNLPAKTLELVISDFRQEIRVVYDAGVAVHGIVLDSVSNTPVSGFVLELQENPSNEIYDRDISDNQGSFSFSNVTPGNYSISYADDGINRHSGYVGDYGSMMIPTNGSDSVKGLVSANHFSVEKEDISGIVYFVTPTVTTTFSGTVTTPEGTPVKDAFVFSYFENMKTAGSDRTDSEGRFTLEYKMSRMMKSSFQIKLIAEIRDEKPPYWEKSGKGFFLVSNNKNVLAQGSVELPISGGETITGIHIILASLPVRTITGKIHVPADADFRLFTIKASQHGGFIPGEIYEDGTYKIDKVNPGSASIMCEVPSYDFDAGNFGTVLHRDYATEIVVVTIPEDQDILTKDIFMQRSGYLAGIVLDAEGNPVPGVRVCILNHPLGRLPNNVITKPNGTFWHGLLRADEAYTIEVYLAGSEKPIAHFDGLTPSRSDITIKLNK